MPFTNDGFETWVFEQKSAGLLGRWLYTVIIILSMSLVMAGFYFNIGIFNFLTIGQFCYVLYKMSHDEISGKGPGSHGKPKAKLLISENHIEINENSIPYSEMDSLIIYVDYYFGKPRLGGIDGVHHGGNNEIRFRWKNKLHSFNYVIGDKQEFQQVSALVRAIEKKYPPTN